MAVAGQILPVWRYSRDTFSPPRFRTATSQRRKGRTRMLDSGMTSRRNLFKLAGLGAAAVGAGGLLAACGDDKAVGGTTVTAPNALAKSTPFRIASAPVDNSFIDAVNHAHHHFAKYTLEVPKFLYPSSGVQSMQ